MKLVTYTMQHDKKSKENWGVILDELAPDNLLAQESLPPDQYQGPLLGDAWSTNVVWAPVWSVSAMGKCHLHPIRAASTPEITGV